MTGERGSVSLIAAGIMTMLFVLAVASADLARVLSAAARAQTAADAAALAAAQELALPSGETPSSVAAGYAEKNGAELIACSCPPGSGEAVVEVRIPTGDLMMFPDTEPVHASARAVVDLPQ